MSTISRQLIGPAAEHRHQMIRQAGSNVKERFLAGSLMVDHGGFDEMTRAIKFMQVTKILETVSRTPCQDVTVQIPVRLLSPREKFDRSLDQGFQLGIFGVLEISARRLEPFGDVRVPKDAAAPIPIVRFLPATVHALVEPKSIQLALVPHLIVDVPESDLSYLLLQLIPEAAGKNNLRMIEWFPRGKHV